jgi:hypothetical protein
MHVGLLCLHTHIFTLSSCSLMRLPSLAGLLFVQAGMYARMHACILLPACSIWRPHTPFHLAAAVLPCCCANSLLQNHVPTSNSIRSLAADDDAATAAAVAAADATAAASIPQQQRSH